MSTDKTNKAGMYSSTNLTESVDITDANNKVSFQPEPETSKPKKKKDKKLEAHKKYQAFLRAKSKYDGPFEIIERPAASQTSFNGGKGENLDKGWVDRETFPGDSDDDDDDDEPLRLEWEKFKMKMDIEDEPTQSGTGNVGEAAQTGKAAKVQKAAKHKRNQRSS